MNARASSQRKERSILKCRISLFFGGISEIWAVDGGHRVRRLAIETATKIGPFTIFRYMPAKRTQRKHVQFFFPSKRAISTANCANTVNRDHFARPTLQWT